MLEFELLNIFNGEICFGIDCHHVMWDSLLDEDGKEVETTITAYKINLGLIFFTIAFYLHAKNVEE